MLRWNDVEETEIFGLSVKMYREPFKASETVKSSYKNIEFDHQAYRYFESELYMYRVLDVNFDVYMEERGDLSRIDVLIPVIQDSVNTVL